MDWNLLTLMIGSILFLLTCLVIYVSFFRHPVKKKRKSKKPFSSKKGTTRKRVRQRVSTTNYLIPLELDEEALAETIADLKRYLPVEVSEYRSIVRRGLEALAEARKVKSTADWEDVNLSPDMHTGIWITYYRAKERKDVGRQFAAELARNSMRIEKLKRK